MTDEQTTVADLFRRSQKIRMDNPKLSYKEVAKKLVGEFEGKPFPPTYNLTIPEQDDRAPEEDWTAGLPLVLRGIQMQDWSEVAKGITLCLEQTENFEKARSLSLQDEWHNRDTGIKEAADKGLSKWMPEELMRLAERSAKRSGTKE